MIVDLYDNILVVVWVIGGRDNGFRSVFYKNGNS